MNRRMTITAAFVLMLGIWTAGAQTTFDRVNGVDPWSWGRNSAGMRTASPVRVSDAEVFGGFGSGGFKASHEASSLWKAGAGARTRVDLQRFSMTGAFSFVQEQGEGMCGSMFIHPGSYPVDVLEFTPGRKTLQTYSISGGIAVPLDDRWTLGGRFDFESGNYSKRKDIRHTNYRLDMTVAPSVTLSLDGWTIGVSAVFRKTSESIQAEQIGTATADSYFAFLDKGMIFGSYQVWNGSGIHLAEAGIDVLPSRNCPEEPPCKSPGALAKAPSTLKQSISVHRARWERNPTPSSSSQEQPFPPCSAMSGRPITGTMYSGSSIHGKPRRMTNT